MGRPKISRFFFSSPALFLCLSGCLLVEFWWWLKPRDTEMCAFGVLGLLCEAPADHQNSTRRKPRETQKERNGGGRGKKKSEILGCPAEGGPAEGKSGGRWSREVQTNNNHNNHDHNNAKPRTSGARRVAPRRVGPLSEGLGFGSLGFGLFGFRKFGQDTKTLKLAKVGLAKVGQHFKTLKLAKVGLAKVCHDRIHVNGLAKNELAQIGLAKVGHNRSRHLRCSRTSTPDHNSSAWFHWCCLCQVAVTSMSHSSMRGSNT